MDRKTIYSYIQNTISYPLTDKRFTNLYKQFVYKPLSSSSSSAAASSTAAAAVVVAGDPSSTNGGRRVSRLLLASTGHIVVISEDAMQASDRLFAGYLFNTPMQSAVRSGPGAGAEPEATHFSTTTTSSSSSSAAAYLDASSPDGPLDDTPLCGQVLSVYLSDNDEVWKMNATHTPPPAAAAAAAAQMSKPKKSFRHRLLADSAR